jgi:hypothetical protein
MSLTKYTDSTNIIGSIGTTVEERGLTTQEFKDAFDENPEKIVAFINAMIDELASTSSGKGASAIGIQDAGGLITAANVESALAELAGTGRTTESLKSLADLISTHTADLITDSNGVHGFKEEVGAFTPVLYGSTTAGAPTYTAQTGLYVLQGKIVHFKIGITISSMGGLVGAVRISGWPVAPKYSLRESAEVVQIENWTKPSDIITLAPGIYASYLELRYNRATTEAALTEANISNTLNLRISGWYEIS